MDTFTILSYAEEACMDSLMATSEGQLVYMHNQFAFNSEFDKVEFTLFTRNKAVVFVRHEFFIGALLNEIQFRGVEV